MSNTSSCTLPVGELEWYQAPNLRSWQDIIRACLVTIFLCSWGVISPNVKPWNAHSEGRSKFTNLFSAKLRHVVWMVMSKALLMCLSIGGPEFVLQLAIGQWCQARQSKREFRSLKGIDGKKWTMTHAFYADAGGFQIQTKDYTDQPDQTNSRKQDGFFVVNSAQLYWLVRNRIILFEDILLSEEELDSKNKQDGFGRIITVIQITWFYIIEIYRLADHLHVTALEVTTLTFITCSLPTFFLWFKKPGGCDFPTVIHVDKYLEEFVDKHLLAHYRQTPLEHIRRRSSAWYRYWSHWKNLVWRLHIDMFRGRHRPALQIEDDTYPQVAIRVWPLLMIAQAACVGIPAALWNHEFPTYGELIAWRVAVVMTIVAATICWAVLTGHDVYEKSWRYDQQDMYTWENQSLVDSTASTSHTPDTNAVGLLQSEQSTSHPDAGKAHQAELIARLKVQVTEIDADQNLAELALHPMHRFDAHQRSGLLGQNTKPRLTEHGFKIAQWPIWDKLRNDTLLHDPDLAIPIRTLMFMNLAVILYVSGRAMILILDFTSLRSQPASTYQTPTVLGGLF